MQLQVTALLECVVQLRYLAQEVQAAGATAATLLVDMAVTVPLDLAAAAAVQGEPRVVAVLAATAAPDW